MTRVTTVLVVLATIAMAEPAVADGQVQPGLGLSAYDATGKLVGPFYPYGSGGQPGPVSGSVSVKIGSERFNLTITRDNLNGTRNNVLLFESSNCTGDPFLQVDDPGELLRGVAVSLENGEGLTGGTVWVSDGPAIPIVDRSNLELPDGPCNQYPDNTEPRLGEPARHLTDSLDVEFIPPFTVM